MFGIDGSAPAYAHKLIHQEIRHKPRARNDVDSVIVVHFFTLAVDESERAFKNSSLLVGAIASCSCALHFIVQVCLRVH